MKARYLRLVGAALIAYYVYRDVTQATTGSGTADDPFRVTSVSPELLVAGVALILWP